MRPPHVVPGIAVTPARLLALLLIVLAVALLALAVQRRRVQVAEEVLDEPLARLRGFHLFGPDDDELPHVHVPVLRTRTSAAERPPVPGTPAALRATAVARAQVTPHAVTPTVAPAVTPAVAPAVTPAVVPAVTPAVVPAVAPAPAATAPPPLPPAPAPVRRKLPTPPPRTSSAARDAARDLSGTPATRPARRARTVPREAPAPDGDILLVEDDAMIASMYRTLLAARGYQARHAHDGVEGVAMVRERRPALILLDMMMPRMDGIQFLEALRGWPRTESIPVVVLSNVGDRHLVERAMSLGAVEYLVKAQTRPQVLLGALPHWLRGNRALTTLS
jgi:CheY-like chemotaxis protein